MTIALMAGTDELCPGYRGVYRLLSGFIGQLIWVEHKAVKADHNILAESYTLRIVPIYLGFVYDKYVRRLRQKKCPSIQFHTFILYAQDINEHLQK